MLCLRACVFWFSALAIAAPAQAAVSPEKAVQLKSVLTPVGAERAGNKDGSIPSWTGGTVTPPSGYREGDPRPDPFVGDKPLFSITAKNLDSYADHSSQRTWRAPHYVWIGAQSREQRRQHAEHGNRESSQEVIHHQKGVVS